MMRGQKVDCQAIAVLLVGLRRDSPMMRGQKGEIPVTNHGLAEG